ncbi:MAG: O-antigen polymerase [Latilactobacillus curvatus]
MDTKWRSKGFINPYIIFSSIFFLVYVLYQIPYSNLNMELDIKLKTFLLIAIFINFILGITFKSNFALVYYKNPEFDKSRIRVLTFLMILAMVIEGVYSKGFPILKQVNYKDYGVPVLHVILVTVDSFYILVLVKKLYDNRFKSNFIIFNILLATIPLLVSLSRGIIMILLLNILYLVILSTKRIFSLKKLLGILIIMIGGLYVFGIAGNYRMNTDYKRVEDIRQSSLILSIGQASTKFNDSHIPAPYFWTYSYGTSPIANLNMNIQNVLVDDSHIKVRNVTEFMVINFLPDFISKRIYPDETIRVKPNQIIAEFTAVTAFAQAYLMLGWGGLYVYLLYILIFPIVYIEIIKKVNPEFSNIALAMMATLYTLLPFSNFFAFTGLSLQLVFPIIMTLFKGGRFK